MNNTFGNFLRNLRKERRLSLREVERKAKISNAYLSQIERGQRGIPTLGFLKRLASVYGIDVNILVKKALQEIQDEKNEEEGFYKKLGQDIPSPDILYIMEGYDLLTISGQKQLYKFLQFLLENESKS